MANAAVVGRRPIGAVPARRPRAHSGKCHPLAREPGTSQRHSLCQPVIARTVATHRLSENARHAMIRFSCACGRSLKAPEELAGKKSRCPACAAAVVVPQPAMVFAGCEMSENITA